MIKENDNLNAAGREPDTKLPAGIDLHLHLDGSMPLRLIRELAEKEGRIPAGKRVEDLVRVGKDCRSLKEFLSCFTLMEQLLGNKESLERCACELVETLSSQGLSYAEIRFSPFLFVSETMNEEEAVEAVISGVKQGCSRSGMPAGVILCALVQGSDEQNRKALELTKQYFRKGIDGFDLAGPEGLVPMEHFRPLFAEVSRCSIPFTIHAGECGDPENVRTAVSFGAKRIGHGTAAAKSKEIMDLLRREDVTLEVCVTSNVQNCAVPDIASHPVRRFFDEGIKVTYNTDDMTVSGITLQSEAQLLSDKFGFTADELAQMQQNAAMASFAPERMIKKT